MSPIPGRFSLEDVSEVTCTKSLRLLIDHGADVNVCDDLGKSPLDYAANLGEKYLVQTLLHKGADIYLKDKFGMTALDYAATTDGILTQAIIDKYNFPMKRVIEALESIALNADAPLEILRKATILREEHGIPKTTLPPLECYCYEEEWESVHELENYTSSDEAQLMLQCILARKRICQERNLDVDGEHLARKGKHKFHDDCHSITFSVMLNSYQR